MRRPSAALGVAAAFAVLGLLAGCGGMDGGMDHHGGRSSDAYVEPRGRPQETARIEAGNLYFRPDEVKLPAGVNRIEMVGEGGVHTLVIDGVPDFELRVEGDERDSAKVDLDAGTYEFFCDIPGHREAGMEGEILVS